MANPLHYSTTLLLLEERLYYLLEFLKNAVNISFLTFHFIKIMNGKEESSLFLQTFHNFNMTIQVNIIIVNSNINNNIVNIMEWLPECRKTVNTFVNTSILDTHSFNAILLSIQRKLTILLNVCCLLLRR